jgi:purine-binding chemotaxis protein CheW
LICRVGSCLAALPLVHVVETMRLLPIETIGGAPPYVLGVATVRGEPVPVVDGASVLGLAGARPARLVTLDVRGRRVALAVDDVVGVRDVPSDLAPGLPPLLHDAAEAVASIRILDDDLLLVLRGARLVPEPVWDVLVSGTPAR